MIKHIKQLNKILGGMQGISTFDVWQPFLRDAAELHIKPAIGPELYTHLNALITQADYGLDVIDTATAAEKELLEFLRPAMANYADLYSSQRLGMANSDAGKADPSGQHSTSSPKWKVMSSLELVRDKADDYLEKSLQLLVDKADQFTVYTASTFFTKFSGMLIHSANRLTEYLPACNGSHTFYQALRHQLVIQQGRCVDILGQEFYDEILVQNKRLLGKQTVTGEYQLVIRKLCKLIASRAMVSALPYLNISEDFRTKTRIGGLEDKSILTDLRRSELKLLESQSAESAMVSLVQYLNTNATASVLPLYFNSPYYTAPVSGSTNYVSKLDNSDPTAKYAHI